MCLVERVHRYREMRLCNLIHQMIRDVHSPSRLRTLFYGGNGEGLVRQIFADTFESGVEDADGGC